MPDTGFGAARVEGCDPDPQVTVRDKSGRVETWPLSKFLNALLGHVGAVEEGLLCDIQRLENPDYD